MSNVFALIIEDNVISSEVLRELLSSESVVCSTIQDPRIVPEYMRKQTPPDIIFLDLEMPHVDGYEVLDLLKADPDWSPVPVVAYTVHVSELQNARKKAFHSFLGKPLDADRFPGQLSQILNGENVWDITPTT